MESEEHFGKSRGVQQENFPVVPEALLAEHHHEGGSADAVEFGGNQQHIFQLEPTATIGAQKNKQSRSTGGGSGGKTYGAIRSKTQYRGVTQVVSKLRQKAKYDVQFVFCDAGVKKHPKIYGFNSIEQAARAFDVLLLKRHFERFDGGKTPEEYSIPLELETNNPASDYAYHKSLLMLIANASRDQIVYALKDVSKSRLPFTKESMYDDLRSKIVQEDVNGGQTQQQNIGVEERYDIDKEKRTSYEKNGVDERQAKAARVSTDDYAPDALENSLMMQMLQNLNSELPKSFPSTPRDSEGNLTHDGLYFVLEVCRLCGQKYPELLLCHDMLSVWNACVSSGNGLDDVLKQVSVNFPGHVYRVELEDIVKIESLRDAMKYVMELWSSGRLSSCIEAFMQEIEQIGEENGGNNISSQQNMSPSMQNLQSAFLPQLALLQSAGPGQGSAPRLSNEDMQALVRDINFPATGTNNSTMF